MYLQPAAITTSQHFIQAFSWMLLHSLWQGLLLAILSGFILVLTKKSSSVKRYNLLLAQLLFFIAGCIFTFAWEWTKSPAPGFAGAVSNPEHARLLFFELNANGLQQFAKDCIYWVSANAPFIVLVWLLLFIMRSVRLMGSLVYIHRARHRFVYQPSEYWAGKVDELCEKLQLNRAVRLLESGYVKMPMVIGHLKPIILVPMGLIAGLPAGQVEAILLHELAHIRRYDYAVNFLQTITETIFCFNPGLLWMSSVLRDERENCCDDIALAQTKNKKEFVEALISFKEHALYGSRYQVAFPGKKNHLLNRVSRIISNKNRALGLSEKTSFVAGAIILMAMMATAAISGSRHIRDTIVKTGHQVLKPSDTITHDQKTRTSVNISIREVHKTHTGRSRNVEAVSASENDSLSIVAHDDHVENVDDRASIDRRDMAVASRRERVADASQVEKLQADRDQEQALKDQEQAKKDQAQAAIDQVQARRDQVQALKDQEQAHYRDETRLNQVEERKNAGQDARNKEQVRLNEVQSQKNREQAARNQEQARLNRIQDARNQEQARLNEIQAEKNRKAAKQNVSVQE